MGEHSGGGGGGLQVGGVNSKLKRGGVKWVDTNLQLKDSTALLLLSSTSEGTCKTVVERTLQS